MTVISNSRRFIFVHIPKTGGSSVTYHLTTLTRWNDIEIGCTPFGKAMLRFFRDRFGIGKHATAAQIRGIVGEKIWTKYRTFAVVRNPYQRVVSSYNFMKNWNAGGGAPKETDIIRDFDTFESFVLGDYWRSGGFEGIFLPQSHWVTEPGKPRSIIVDEVLKLEDLLDDCSALNAMLGLEHRLGRSLPRRNRAPMLAELPLSGRVAKEIATHHKSDFELFGYSTEVPSDL